MEHDTTFMLHTLLLLPGCWSWQCFYEGKDRGQGKEENRAWKGPVMLWDIILPIYLCYLLSSLFLPPSGGEYNKHTRITREVQGKHKGSTSTSFPCGSAGKEFTCNVGDLGSIPGLGRFPGEGKGYPLQYSGLENSMGCIVHGVPKSQTWLSNFHSLPHSQGVNKVRVYASGGGGALALMLSKQVGFGFWLQGPQLQNQHFSKEFTYTTVHRLGWVMSSLLPRRGRWVQKLRVCI